VAWDQDLGFGVGGLGFGDMRVKSLVVRGLRVSTLLYATSYSMREDGWIITIGFSAMRSMRASP